MRQSLTCFGSLQRLIFVCLLVLAAASGFAREVAPGTPSHARFSTAEVRPWGWVDAEGRVQGTTVVLVDRLSELAGIPVTNHIRPYPRTIYEVETGEVDFAVMFAGESSDRIGIDLGRVADMAILVVGRPEQPAIESLADLKGKSVGFIRGAIYGESFETDQSVRKVPMRNMSQGLRMLLLGRIQAMVGTDRAILYTLQEMNIQPAQIKTLKVLDHTDGRLYFSRASKNVHLIEPFRKALQTMRENGDLERIFGVPANSLSGP